jgi:hypothetical protein
MASPEKTPSNALKPEVFTDLIDRGFRERDAEMMVRGLLKLDEDTLKTKLKFIATGLPSQRLVSLASGESEALQDAADYDLLRFADLCRSLKDKTLAEIRPELEKFHTKERERMDGFSPQA